MRPARVRLAVFAAGAVLAATAPAAAPSGPAPVPVPAAAPRNTAFAALLPDPRYASAPFAPQDVTPVALIGALVYPTVGFPALAAPGGTLEVLLAPPAAPPGLLAPADFTVTLRLRRGAAPFFDPGAAPAPAARAPASEEVLLERALPVRTVTPRADGAVALEAAVPLDTPAFAFDLAVAGPPALLPRGEEVQPLAVRVRAPGDGFAFVLAADHQLWDPSSFVAAEKNAGAYPGAGAGGDAARVMALQVQHELGLLAPAFVLHAGDLFFGLDYARETADSLALWRGSAFTTFFAPGNHDAYASYTLDFTAAAGALKGKTGKCTTLRPSSFEPIAFFRYAGCLFGDTKDVLFRHLVEDGLVSWTRSIGPPWYAFDVEGFRFIVLDTYDGSAARRHAIVLGLGWAGLDVGVPTTDNYGGWLGPVQLAWLERTAREGAEAGLTVVVVGHHDPRGNLEEGADRPLEERYTENDPFPTAPFGTGPFEEWNYDGAWDSDPADGRGAETPAANSGTAVLAVLARYASYYLYGHGHDDGLTRYESGREIAPGVVAAHPLEFVRVTTAAAMTRADGYRGYRVLRARAGRLEGETLDDALGLSSWPAGNFWLSGRVKPGLALPSVVLEGHNALPVAVDARLALPLPPFAGGWDARAGGTALRLVEAASGDHTAVLAWALPLPGIGTAAKFPPAPGAETITRVDVRPAAGNHPPAPRIRVLRSGIEVGDGAYLPSGDTIVFSAAPSTDPDGEPAWRALWDFGDGGGALGPEAAHVFVGVGERTVRLTLTDPHGASASTQVSVHVSPPVIAPPGPPAARGGGGCHCGASPGARSAPTI